MSLEDTIGYQNETPTCIVCGKNVEGGGGFARVNHKGIMVNLCCPGCMETFSKAPSAAQCERLPRGRIEYGPDRWVRLGVDRPPQRRMVRLADQMSAAKHRLVSPDVRRDVFTIRRLRRFLLPRCGKGDAGVAATGERGRCPDSTKPTSSVSPA